MSEPMFSVIIPSYNRAAFLDRALRSVLAQTCQDFEVIIADDGSTDRTPELIAQWQQQFNGRLHPLWLAHGGAAAARNAGIAASRGQMIAFLDSDDEWLPHHLATCREALGREPDAGLIFTDHIIQSDARIRTRAPRSQSQRELVRSIILRRVVLATPAIAISRAAVAAVGSFNEALHGTEDWELWARIAVHYPVAQASEATAVIYQHPDNYSCDPFKLETHIHAAARAICRLPIAPYCRTEEVLMRAHLDAAEFYAMKAERRRAWRNLALAAWHGGAAVVSRDYLRATSRAVLSYRAYRWLRAKVWRGVFNRQPQAWDGAMEHNPADVRR